ncbi:IclR family transcriptional regulator [Caldimonas thermodepolymerans]|uniref:IclR family transcriptional regulator n=1 Tax=Caldimonas thermodepolymerans TaxID=215580 RepID=A0A2S5T326_9BURK|nr:IclR family transcriptional regulator [Caldimonas thermodepolymerans]PPE69298.1 IclR family transcriptional regulator [Caldimonas thermodepolymerans]QPC31026.1 IclR family transcriptional regulator [Caldimonas thermodepolymerans]RDH96250.1 IclR family transcriptional regulator [Caldimonas thermodepolymerans]TCP04170.1 IclR family transcriptional regulator [Caldimonas thermodepolymerans]UZG43750.1 IclR family transcriptional regulator [Caldimonas thermodepolymerans]
MSRASNPPSSATAGPRQQPGDSFVQSFARGLAVVRTFSAEAPAQTITEVAERAGLTRAGARRILHTLQHLGYVESEGRLFRLTPKILDLGFAYLSSLPLWNLAEPVMEDLVQEVKESCSAAVLDATDIVYVLRVPTHKIMAINLGVGSRLPAFCTSMGRVLLAGLPDEEVQARLARSDLQPRTPRTETDPRRLLELIQQVRLQGWALVGEELEEGLVSLAAPIRGRAGEVVAAINISGQQHRTPPVVMLERFLPRLLKAAHDISAMIGGKVGR